MKKYLLLACFVASALIISESSYAETYFLCTDDNAGCLDSVIVKAQNSTSAQITVTGYKDSNYFMYPPVLPDVTETFFITGNLVEYGRDTSPAHFESFNELTCVQIYSSNDFYVEDLSFVECCTLVTLASFEVKPGNEKALITWTTESETNNAGFNIYRAEAKNGDYTKINDALIPAQGSTQEGATYTYTDEGLQNRKAYFYQLEDIDTEGTAFLHDPVRVVPRMFYQYME